MMYVSGSGNRRVPPVVYPSYVIFLLAFPSLGEIWLEAASTFYFPSWILISDSNMRVPSFIPTSGVPFFNP